MLIVTITSSPRATWQFSVPRDYPATARHTNFMVRQTLPDVLPDVLVENSLLYGLHESTTEQDVVVLCRDFVREDTNRPTVWLDFRYCYPAPSIAEQAHVQAALERMLVDKTAELGFKARHLLITLSWGTLARLYVPES